MDHVLTVGEIYDKAVDLCLRNAGKIALMLGLYFLIVDSLLVLHSDFRGSWILTAMHVRPRDPRLPGEWIPVVGNVAYFTLLPIIGAALCVVFDRSLSGRTVSLKECIASEWRLVVNVILEALLSNLLTLVTGAPVILAITAVFLGLKLSMIFFAIPIAAYILLTYLTILITFGTAIGFACVALDGGRVLHSFRIGFGAAFAKKNQLRAVAVGAPLVLVIVLGTIAGLFGGIEAYELTGWDAANVFVQTIGNVVAFGLLAAVATVSYRNLVPMRQP